MNVYKTIIGLLVLSLFSPAAFSAEQLKKISCVMHLHSSFSGPGNKDLSDIVREAKDKYIDVVIPADHDIARLEYGIVSRSERSVLRSGPARYLDEIARLNKENPDTIVIPGVESTPFYYWTGNPLTRSLQLHDWHKHIIIAGLYDEDDYYDLPLVSNRHAGTFSAVRLWPVLVLAAAVFFKRKKIYFYLFITAGSLLLINNYPFRSSAFNQYSGPKNEAPYANLTAYAESRGALTFLAHPEAKNYKAPVAVGPIHASTPPYPESIASISGLTGFGALSEGYETAFDPEGSWDKALAEYCNGERPRPLWGMGELDYGEKPAAIDEIQNILWVKEKSKESVIESLRDGNFFAVWQQGKRRDFTFDDFRLTSGDKTAVCGQEIEYGGPVRLEFTLGSKENIPCTARVTVIRNGKIIKTVESTVPSRIVIEDSETLPKGKNYYRAVIKTSSSCYIALNPVFIKKG